MSIERRYPLLKDGFKASKAEAQTIDGPWTFTTPPTFPAGWYGNASKSAIGADAPAFLRFKSYNNTTGSTGFPGEFGVGFQLDRAADGTGSADGSFQLWSNTNNTDKQLYFLRYQFGTGWETFKLLNDYGNYVINGSWAFALATQFGVSGTNGFTSVVPGSGVTPGYIEFKSNDSTRRGYHGWQLAPSFGGNYVLLANENSWGHCVYNASPDFLIYSPAATARVTIRGNSPQLQVWEEDAIANERSWFWLASAGSLQLRAYTDDLVSSEAVMQVSRSSYAITILDLFGDKIRLAPNGTTNFQTGDFGSGSTRESQFIGTTYNSHFNYGTSEATYIRAGKAGGNVYLNDASTGNVYFGGSSYQGFFRGTDGYMFFPSWIHIVGGVGFFNDANDYFYNRNGSGWNIRGGGNGSGVYNYLYLQNGSGATDGFLRWENGTNSIELGSDTGGRIAISDWTRVTTTSGYVEIGPQNTGYNHFYTDRALHYMNKPLHVETSVSEYNSGSPLELGYKDLRSQTQNAAYTFALTDRDGVVVHNSATAHTYTIPLSSTTNFPVGTVINIINHGSGAVSITGSITLIWAGSGTTGTRSLAQYGWASITKAVATDTWYITGAGLT